MIKTNMRENEGGAIFLTPDGKMLLLCGPLFWDRKQNDTIWQAGQGPDRVGITVEVTVPGLPDLKGKTGVLGPGRNPNSWAVAIPVGDSASLESLRKAARDGDKLLVKGVKDYPDFNASPTGWAEQLPVIDMSEAVASEAQAS